MGAVRLVFNACSLLALAGLAWILAWSGLRSQDLPWRALCLGRLLAENGGLPAEEGILYTVPDGRGFDASAWAWDWLARWLYIQGGEAALRIYDAAVLGLALVGLLGAAFRRGARPFSSALFAAWALWAARPDLQPGPGLTLWAIFAVALWLLEGPFWPAFFNRWIWLPPLALLAVNLHPSAWALALLALPWLALERGEPAQAPPQPRLARWIWAGVLLFCLGLHPQGPLAAARAYTALPPSPLLPGAFEARQPAFLLLVFGWLCLLAAAWTPQGAVSAYRDRAVLGAFSLLALFSRGALPWALAVVAPLAAQRSGQVVDALPPFLRAWRWPLKLGLVAAAALYFARHGLGSGAVAPPPPRPDRTLAFYETELLDLRVLCPPDWTPWLAWKLAPHARFALDDSGRAAAPLAAAAQRALSGGEGWRQGLDACGADGAWLPRGSPLAVALARASGWQPVAFDNASVLYVKATPALAGLIRVHAPRGLRPGDAAGPFDPLRLAETEADLEMRLARDPNLGVLYLYLAELWLAKDQPAKARQTLEAGIRADPAFADNYARLARLRAERGELEAARQLYGAALRRRADPAWAAALRELEAR